MKNDYTEPEMELVRLEDVDVVRTSEPDNEVNFPQP